ncbi:MAG: hypothetical protein Q9175_002564 [Cornicularia normoerica]
MFSPHIALLCVIPFLAISSTNAAPPPPGTNTVNLRIEGDNSTYYEGPITSGPRNITLPSLDGYPTIPRPCNGLPGNPTPSNTPIDALDAAAKASGFTYNGGFDSDIIDFSISRISTSDQNAFPNKLWGTLVNYQVSKFPEGIYLSGCQQEVKAGDDVLWAFITLPPNTDSTNGILFLKLAPSAVTVKKGKGFTVTVTDGRSGVAVQNASVDGVHTDAGGKATLYLFDTGVFHFKAHQTGNVRSNVMNVTVTN